MTATLEGTVARRSPKIYGAQTPRLYTPPRRELTPETTLGPLVTEFSTEVLGIKPYPWQSWFYDHALELNEDGTLRFSEVHLTLSRQNGKTRTIKTLILWRMFVHQRENLVIGAAQNRGEAFSTWSQVKEEASNNPLLSEYMHRGSMKGGSEFMGTVYGSKYMVVTLKDDAGRGKTAGTLFLDELREHETWGAWSSLSSTTLYPENSLILTASNAGDSKSVVMRSKREHAVSAITRGDTDDETVGWFEWSAPEGCEITDMEAVAQANPSLGYGLSLKSIKSEMSKPENEFRTENLCQWVDVLEAGVIPFEAWEAALDNNSTMEEGTRVSCSVDVSWDRGHAYIAVAFDRPDGRRHVEVVAHSANVDWVVGWFQERLTLTRSEARKLGLPGAQEGVDWFDGRVAVQERGAPASSLIPELKEAGIEVVPVGGADLAISAGRFYDKLVVEEGETPVIVHRNEPVLDDAVRAGKAKSAGDAWFFDRKGSRMDVSPLVACSQADWLHDQPVPKKRQSAYATGAAFEIL